MAGAAQSKARPDRSRPALIGAEQLFVLDNITWSAYCAIGDALGERYVRLTFDRGRLDRAIENIQHLVNADQSHPATAGLPNPWNLAQEEMYHIKNQDRSKVRSLLYLRHDPNETEKQMFFPVAWVHQAGKGRVFYTSLGHREDLWSDDAEMKDRKNSVDVSRQYQAHILGGIKWALGLVEGSATPNPDVK